MKKIILVVIVSLVLTLKLNAQIKPFAVSAGLEVAFPTGSFSNLYSTAVGVSAIFEKEVRSGLDVTGTLGYLHFGGKLNQFADYSSNAVMLLAGVKYYFLPGYNFYGLSQLGIHFFSNTDLKVQNQNTEINFAIDQSSSRFSFAIGGGYEIPAGLVGEIDLSAKFMIISDANYFGLRAGYKFKF